MDFASSHILDDLSAEEEVDVNSRLHYSDCEISPGSEEETAILKLETVPPGNKKTKKTKVKKSNTNVVSVVLGTLSDEGKVITGDPVFCPSCHAVLSGISVIHPQEQKQDTNTESVPPTTSSTSTAPPDSHIVVQHELVTNGYWDCEFCGVRTHVNLDPEEVPKERTLDYIISLPAPHVLPSRGAERVIFCVDISGSMCVSSELSGKIGFRGAERLRALASLNVEAADQYLPTQNRDTTWVSRLQCVQAAVDSQLIQLSRHSPESVVGLVTFNNEVAIFGDGHIPPLVVTGDKLNNFEALKDDALAYELSEPIGKSYAKLSDSLFRLEEGGQTALGPALLVSVAMASKKPGSSVIICTDGLANVGLGSLDTAVEEQKAKSVSFFTRVSEFALSLGVSVSIVTIKGTDCKLVELGNVAEATGGQVKIVDPLKLAEEFATILSEPVIASNCNVKLLLSRFLRFRVDDQTPKQNLKEHITIEGGVQQMEKQVGNVTKSTEATFEYSVVHEHIIPNAQEKAASEPAPKLPDSLPFQVQVRFKRMDGLQCIRVITDIRPVTQDRATAEREAKIAVLSTHMAQQAAELAMLGEYSKARAQTYSNKEVLRRISLQSPSNQHDDYAVWKADAVKMEKTLKKAVKTERMKGLQLSDDEGVRPEEQLVTKAMTRRTIRDDSTANTLFQLKAFSSPSRKTRTPAAKQSIAPILDSPAKDPFSISPPLDSDPNYRVTIVPQLSAISDDDEIEADDESERSSGSLTD